MDKSDRFKLSVILKQSLKYHFKISYNYLFFVLFFKNTLNFLPQFEQTSSLLS